MKFLILGGTGTLGRALTKKLVEDCHDVKIFSRCELKQKQMESDFERHPKLSFVLGDIRDPLSVERATRGIDAIFHVAALKHVDVLEGNPEESVKTNILGTTNVAEAAISNGVKYVVFSSTDKAVAPVNVYGMSKAISERILLHKNQIQSHTRFAVYRWGNVIASRGSAIPMFVQAIKAGKPVPVTDMNMSRFWIRIEDAVDYMLATYSEAFLDGPMIPPIKAAPVTGVIEALASLVGAEAYTLKSIPIRPGEKIHESLSPSFSSDSAPQYTREELEDLLKEAV